MILMIWRLDDEQLLRSVATQLGDPLKYLVSVGMVPYTDNHKVFVPDVK